MATPREKRDPYLWEALVSILALVTMISLAIVRYESDAHVPILIGVLVAALVGLRAGFSWKEIETGMLNGITNSLQAIVILGIIGILIGVWILSGVVPTLLYYGLKILHPKIFLPATLIICSITSLATGTSWGTAGTIGIALIGIGSGLGFPLPIVAGAVLSGAYFGDKMSPLSDTTNLAPAMVGTDLYTHIKHMTYTTGVSITITLVIEIALGFFYGGGEANLEAVNQILTGIDAQFAVNPLLLLPPAVVMVLAFRKIPAVPGITIGIIVAAVLGMIFQKNGIRRSPLGGLWRLHQQFRRGSGRQPAHQRRFRIHDVHRIPGDLRHDVRRHHGKDQPAAGGGHGHPQKSPVHRLPDYGHGVDRHRIQPDPVRPIHVHCHDRQDVRPGL